MTHSVHFLIVYNELSKTCCISSQQANSVIPHARHTHTQPFNGPLSGTTRVSRYQKGKINLDFTEARDSEWHWHQLGHMQVCTLLQTDNHASTAQFFYRPDALPAAQPTASKHWRLKYPMPEPMPKGLLMTGAPIGIMVNLPLFLWLVIIIALRDQGAISYRWAYMTVTCPQIYL